MVDFATIAILLSWVMSDFCLLVTLFFELFAEQPIGFFCKKSQLVDTNYVGWLAGKP
jgi:hypothetical protein